MLRVNLPIPSDIIMVNYPQFDMLSTLERRELCHFEPMMSVNTLIPSPSNNIVTHNPKYYPL